MVVLRLLGRRPEAGEQGKLLLFVYVLYSVHWKMQLMAGLNIDWSQETRETALRNEKATVQGMLVPEAKSGATSDVQIGVVILDQSDSKYKVEWLTLKLVHPNTVVVHKGHVRANESHQQPFLCCLCR